MPVIVFIDSNIPMYVAGRQHPNREPSRRFLTAVRQKEIDACTVIEASETSGAKKQARAALEHGRPVFLPQSLVAAHEWVHSMVTKGEHGVRAIEVGSTDEVVDRLTATPAPDQAIAV